jgi:hypothetical protein
MLRGSGSTGAGLRRRGSRLASHDTKDSLAADSVPVRIHEFGSSFSSRVGCADEEKGGPTKTTIDSGYRQAFPHVRRYKITDMEEPNHGTLTYFIIRYRQAFSSHQTIQIYRYERTKPWNPYVLYY